MQTKTKEIEEELAKTAAKTREQMAADGDGEAVDQIEKNTLLGVEKDRIRALESKVAPLQAKADEARYAFAVIVEYYAYNDYDLSDILTEEEETALLDWKVDFELAEAQIAAVQRERFATANAIREAKRQKRTRRFEERKQKIANKTQN